MTKNTLYHNIIVSSTVILTALLSGAFGYYRALDKMLLENLDESGIVLLFLAIAYSLPFVMGLLIGFVFSSVAGTYKRNV